MMKRLILLASIVATCQTTLAALSDTHVMDVDGRVFSLVSPDAKATALIFFSTECPIGNRYVPYLNKLSEQLKTKHIDLYGIVSDPTTTRKAAAEWQKTYDIKFPILFDSSGQLARALSPTRMPEAYVLASDGSLQYRGRIDDGWASIGHPRQNIEHHDLEDALRAVASGQPVATPKTDAVGCFFESNRASSTSSKVSYTRDIAPIVNANCVTCHRPGQVAPFSLLTYEDVSKRAELIAHVTQIRYMPPWKPADHFNQFLHERRLSDDEIALFQTWEKTGAAEGDDADLPPAPTFATGWALGEPDVVLKMPDSFDIPASGRDIYRAFVIPTNFAEDRYIAGVEFKPGNARVVHHAILYLDNSGQARKLDDADPGPGYKSFGGPGFLPSGGLGGWAPGATPYLLKPGTARLVRSGADVVFQMHYHPSGKPESDQSSIAIYFAKQPITRTIINLPLITRDIDIPPGDKNYTRHVTATLPIDATLIGATPHMHLLGRDMKVTATKPDGALVPIIHISNWDFRWQDQYQFANEIRLPKGTRLDLEATYDNSADNPNNPNDPPQRVRHGEQTTNEMCICFLQIATTNPNDARIIRRSLVMDRLAERLLGPKETPSP